MELITAIATIVFFLFIGIYTLSPRYDWMRISYAVAAIILGLFALVALIA